MSQRNLPDRYAMEQLHAHDTLTRRWSAVLICLLIALSALFFLLAYLVWDSPFVMALGILHGLINPCVYPRNLTLVLDFCYYGKTKDARFWPFIKHVLVLSMIEISLVGTALPFLAQISMIWVSIAMAIFLSLALFLVAERDTYYHVRKELAIDKRLKDHQEE